MMNERRCRGIIKKIFLDAWFIHAIGTILCEPRNALCSMERAIQLHVYGFYFYLPAL